MRKRVITPIPQSIYPHDEGWLDLDRVASVEVTSEEKDHGIDCALVSGETRGWRAASPGTQTTRYSADGGGSFREIVRQQWNFSPPDTVCEIKEYQVELSNVTVLELIVVPDIGRGAARASLKNLRLS
jgi:hypothetical protein